jgi:HTH-type transcriptional repressor of NAD biosynthesis genes
MTDTRGFLLGKFMPPHSGHQFLCDFSGTLCDQLTILVCSLKDDPIPGVSRHRWMQDLYPRARVLHCTEDLPQEPADHPDFWPIWRDVMRRYHGERIDRVFASESYGARLAQEAGAEFVPVDLTRSARSVSATQIRSDPMAYWDYIAPPARPWFTRTVCLHGPESSGKTTLANRLTKHFGTCLAPEYGRTYTDVFGTDVKSDDLLRIAHGQNASIEAARRCARGLVISDTDAVLTAVWADLLNGSRDPWFDQKLAVSDLYLLTDIDMPWVDDGTRYFSEIETRRKFFAACEGELQIRNLPYVKISGDEEQRFEMAVEAIREAFPKLS